MQVGVFTILHQCHSLPLDRLLLKMKKQLPPVLFNLACAEGQFKLPAIEKNQRIVDVKKGNQKNIQSIMKSFSILIAISLLVLTSCKKEQSIPTQPVEARTIHFALFTDQDFSTNNSNITFTLSIKNSSGQVLWDSAMAPMAIRNIPSPAHKITVDKPVPHDDGSLLKIGFYYTIEGVGSSWYLDSCRPDEKDKAFIYNFR
jgi:hypothetical protein